LDLGPSESGLRKEQGCHRPKAKGDPARIPRGVLKITSGETKKGGEQKKKTTQWDSILKKQTMWRKVTGGQGEKPEVTGKLLKKMHQKTRSWGKCHKRGEQKKEGSKLSTLWKGKQEKGPNPRSSWVHLTPNK